MARRQKHDEHTNHEAWAIPYGDMITLLLAFFVVMYSISSVNEGKYRVLSDAMSAAFGGPPKSMKPLQFGQHRQSGTNSDDTINLMDTSGADQTLAGDLHNRQAAVVLPGKQRFILAKQQQNASGATGYAANKERAALQHMADEVTKAMSGLIARNMISVRKTDLKLEIEIRTDILFDSGSALVGDKAKPVLAELAGILKPFHQALRIEGHTDNIPIHTVVFASNWELSAARAASVVHLFMEQGVDPLRMSVEGFGEYRPRADNATTDGRNRNRRVVVVVLSNPGQTMPVEGDARTDAPDGPDVTAAAGTAPEIQPAADAASAATPDAAGSAATQKPVSPVPASAPLQPVAAAGLDLPAVKP